MMEQYIAKFPEQLQNALSLVKNIHLNFTTLPVNVVISGMGGSGIAGDFSKDYANYLQSPVPVIINKSYQIPSFVNENTLFIASSYSGNTEETISCLNQAISKKAQIIGITSGGQVEKICKDHNFPLIIIPRGYPPRTALGYSLVSILHILNQAKIISDEWIKEINVVIDLLMNEQANIRQLSKNIAQNIHQSFPIIYSLGSEAPVLRLRQQLNENSKILCSHHLIPEMNHNELVGWKKLSAKHTVIVFKTNFDHPSNIRRLDFCKKVFAQLNVPVMEINAKGELLLVQWLYLVHTADWISYELALLNNVDPVEVKVIDELKKTLSQ